MLIQAVVTDIEGTATSLSFVKEVLFPYARAHMADFVHSYGAEEPVRVLLQDVCREAGAVLGEAALIEQLIAWIDEDRKVTPLKSLQGLIWEKGYRDGAFQGHVYEDAARNLKAWRSQGIALYVYSSGSVFAQKLLFGHTPFGDLTPLFSGFFDTHVGAKQEAEAYRHIALEAGIPPSRMLFLSDVEAELNAARAAGMETIWMVREGALDTGARHVQARSFDDIDLA